MAETFKVYQGYHSQELYELLKSSWENNQRLVICPPHIKHSLALEKLAIPADALLGVYTSGTLSGRPRLVLYSKKNIESSLKAIRDLYQVEKIDKIFCYPQATHTFGLTLGYLQSIIYGIPITFGDGAYSTKAHEKWFQELTPGLLTLGTPTHFIDLDSYLKKNNLSPRSSYTAIVGGAPVTKKLWLTLRDRLKIAEPSVGYGATEASPGIMHLAPGVEPLTDGDIGQVLSGVQVQKIDQSGFAFSGANLCSAIVGENGVHQPTEIFIRDYLTMPQEGRYLFHGRSDLLINRGGLKMSPELIEGRISSELGMKVVCVSLFSERLGEDLGLVIQNSDDDAIDENALIHKTQELLKSEFNLQMPSDHIVVRAIPINANAKYDRNEATKWVLNKIKFKLPLNVTHLKSFLPHRKPAIWVDRLTHFDVKQGLAEVDLDLSSNIFTNGHLRESACIELVAQAFGYAKVAYEISVLHETGGAKQKASRTLIAEIRNAQFNFDSESEELLRQAIAEKIPLQIESTCTHDFGVIKVIRGSVQVKNKILANLSLKAFVSAD